MKELIMKYRTAAPDSAEGWENESLPLGNGFLGANVFGIVERDRIQLTHNALVNPGEYGGLNNLAEIYLQFPHTEVEDYERGLSLTKAEAYCRYRHEGVAYVRKYFASYPQKAVVIRLEASAPGALNCEVIAQIPYIKEYTKEPGDGAGKSGSVTCTGDTICFRGELHYYHVLFEGQVKVLTDGVTSRGEKGIKVEKASSATVIIAADTNYVLCETAFCEEDPKKKTTGEDPHEKVSALIAAAAELGYEKLWENHLQDYQSLFGRVNLSLDNSTEGYITDMMEAYRRGEAVPYLEELYFQFGRYLLISASRKGGLPANLQGIWNVHDESPWGSGYWHNINVQMNYWPAFNTNLLETFEPYIDFFRAYLPKAEQFASEYIKEFNPENYKEEPGECGWAIGTASYPYCITEPNGHSGPGTGGLTSKLFWEAYAFSGDRKVLEDVTYPALLGMSKMLTKTVKDYDGQYLVSPSASPEQLNSAPYGGKTYYRTVGCAFDQQMIWENGRDVLASADILSGGDGVTNLSEADRESLAIQREQMDKYNPVEVGWSGQIKEFSEENFYGEIGAYNHRHISHLMALYPGTLINSSTEAWMDAARVSLTNRGNNATGWALGHRLNAWARTGDGNASYEVVRKLISEKTMQNLWDLHPPFQIDGNFGATAGIAEMLLQSHNDCIEILPALPDAWEKGTVEGLLARGGFAVSVSWEQGAAENIQITSQQGGLLKIKYPGIGAVCAERAARAGSDAACIWSACQVVSGDMIALSTEMGGCYVFENLPRRTVVADACGFTVVRPTKENLAAGITLQWKSEDPVNVYRAIGSAPEYEKIAEQVTGDSFTDPVDFAACETITYKIKAVKNGQESRGVYTTVNHATQLQIDRYTNSILKMLLPSRGEW